MGCWSEGSIEWAAIRLESGDISPGIEAFVVHASGCVRCGELLALFRGMEQGIRRDLPPIRALPLVAVRGDASRAMELADSPAVPVEYDVAAETARSSRIADITLATEDGSFIVRIFPASSGEGARAVLVSPADDPSRVSLRIGDREYPFDDSGIVEIPRFPASEIHLVAF